MRDPGARLGMALLSLALAASLVGSAIAGTDALTKPLTKSKVKQIAAAQANKAIDARSASLSVASAKNADSATSAGTAASADTAKNADALGGQPPSAFAPAAVESSHGVGSAGEPP